MGALISQYRSVAAELRTPVESFPRRARVRGAHTSQLVQIQLLRCGLKWNFQFQDKVRIWWNLLRRNRIRRVFPVIEEPKGFESNFNVT